MRLGTPARVCMRIRKNGEKCKAWVIPGRDFCRIHGGKALRGIAHPGYGHIAPGSGRLPGAGSRFIPLQLAADYRRAKSDPARLSLIHEISLWHAREQQLLKRFDTTHDAGASWADVDIAWRALEDAKAALDTAQAAKDILGMRTAYHRFEETLARGRAAIGKARSEYGLWKDIKDVHMTLLALRTQEHKRLLDLQRYWDAEQVSLRWGQFLHALWEACTLVLPREHIRPLLDDFSSRIRAINAEFEDLTATTEEKVSE